MKFKLRKIYDRFIKNDGGNFVSVQMHQRLYTVIIFFMVAFIGVSIKLFKVGLSDKATLKNINSSIIHRNEIVDRNGVLLAVDLEVVSLYANPKMIENPKLLAKQLNEIFPDLKTQDLEKLLSSDKNFVWIKRNITPRQHFMVNNLGGLGLEFQKGTKRVYTQRNLFSHILGYVDTDGIGIAGLEKQFDEQIRDPRADKIKLSLDVRVQNIVHEELSKSIKEFNAKGGIGIVMDANNGEIISAVSLPDFDPHYPGHYAKENLFNQFSLGVYEMGSIMKGFTIAMALEAKAVNLTDVYYVKAPIKASRFVIHDYRPKYSYLSVPQVFMHSSNIGTAMISLELGKERQKKFLTNFGMFDEIRLELPEKGQPMYPADRNWNDITTMTISFGHGMAITAIHFIRAAAALVNGGYVYEPTLLLKSGEQEPVTRVISEETSKTMRKLMRLTIEHGSGKKSEVDGYLPGGKTGSAEKSQKGGYSKTSKRSAFFSAFPINNPRYVTLMIIDDPLKNPTTPFTGGAWTAAPLNGRILKRIAPLLDVQPINHNDPEIKNDLWLDFMPEEEPENRSF